MAYRKYTAQTHKRATVPHATNDALIAKTLADVAMGVAKANGFMLFTAACINIVSSRLPCVRQ
jgi:hypothetical protein